MDAYDEECLIFFAKIGKMDLSQYTQKIIHDELIRIRDEIAQLI